MRRGIINFWEIKMANKLEEIQVKSVEVSCDGGGGAVGHPKVYLHIDAQKGSVTCPYCSRTYLLKKPIVPASKRASGH